MCHNSINTNNNYVNTYHHSIIILFELDGLFKSLTKIETNTFKDRLKIAKSWYIFWQLPATFLDEPRVVTSLPSVTWQLHHWENHGENPSVKHPRKTNMTTDKQPFD